MLTKQGQIAFRDDRVGPDHASLRDLVRNHLSARLGRRAIRELRAALGALYEARLTADYYPHRSVSKVDAVEAQKQATSIRNLMERELY